MLKEYVVTFLNPENKVKCDCFVSKTENEATKDFRACYRHGKYKILSIAETSRKLRV